MLRTVFLTLVTIGTAIGGGAGSLYWALDAAAPVGGLRSGPWVAFPDAGSPQADPYSRARFAREGGAPLGNSEGIVFTAVRDSAGQPLERSCTYRIGGAFPAARFWTLHATTPTGDTLVDPRGNRPSALHSAMVVDLDGGPTVKGTLRHTAGFEPEHVAPGQRVRVRFDDALGRKDKDGNSRPPTWFDCSLWGKRAEALEKYILKGTKLTVSGRPTCRAHDGKAYLGIVVDQLTFQSSGGQRQDAEERESSRPQNGGPAGGGMDADIPFQAEWR